MGWIKVDPDIYQHPKTAKLARLLGVSSRVAGDTMIRVWCWAKKFCEDGQLSRYESADIEHGIEYQNEGHLLNNLEQAGFIEQGWIKDWLEWGGAEIKEKYRKNKDKYPQYKETVDHYESKVAESCATVAESCGKLRTEEKRREEKREDIYSVQFESFWTAYPKKVSKGHASKAYVSALKKTTPETILTALKKQIERGGFSNDPKFIPHASTWLNGERWADQVDAGKPQRRGDGGAMLPAGI